MTKTKAERQYMGRVADLGCAVCRRMGYPGTPAELHDKRAGQGLSNRASNWQVIPLCPEHHRGATGVHGLGTRGFAKHWGYGEDALLEDVRAAIEKTYGVPEPD